jgi:hypothetical protein
MSSDITSFWLPVLGLWSATFCAFGQDKALDSLSLLKAQAAQGDAAAQFKVALIFDDGQGVPQDYQQAMKWYRLAAEQGVTEAQNNLGVMYDYGHGVPQNYQEAIKWYRLAAEQGHPLGQFNLGVLYESGKGVPQDYVLAHMWYSLASASGDAESARSRDLLVKKMTRDQIVEAQRLVREWKPTPARQ